MKEFRVTKCLVNSLIGEYAIFADKCKKNWRRFLFCNIVSDYEKQINTSKRKIVLNVKEEDVNAFVEFVDCYEWVRCKRRNYEI